MYTRSMLYSEHSIDLVELKQDKQLIMCQAVESPNFKANLASAPTNLSNYSVSKMEHDTQVRTCKPPLMSSHGPC